LKVDIRFEDQIQAAVDQAVKTFGGIDILINNASAISLTGTADTAVKTYDLMHQINLRGTWLTTKLCLPHLQKSPNPHILNISPPLDMDPKWFGNHVAYTMAKYGMSMCVLGHAEEFKPQGIAVNALWPRTAIATAAVVRTICRPYFPPSEILFFLLLLLLLVDWLVGWLVGRSFYGMTVYLIDCLVEFISKTS